MMSHLIEDALWECVTLPAAGCRITDRIGRMVEFARGSVGIHNKAYVTGQKPSGRWDQVKRRDIAHVEVLP